MRSQEGLGDQGFELYAKVINYKLHSKEFSGTPLLKSLRSPDVEHALVLPLIRKLKV